MHFSKLTLTLLAPLLASSAAVTKKDTTTIEGITIPSSVFTQPAQTINESIANAHANDKSGGKYCGELTIIEGGFIVPMYTSNLCTNVDLFEHFQLVHDAHCWPCFVYNDRDCKGDVRWWGGPGHNSHDVKGAQSYFCI